MKDFKSNDKGEGKRLLPRDAAKGGRDFCRKKKYSS